VSDQDDQVQVAQDRAAAAEARAAAAAALAGPLEQELERLWQQVAVFAKSLVGELRRAGMSSRQATDRLEVLWARAGRRVERMYDRG
jgi:hypothetical protein